MQSRGFGYRRGEKVICIWEMFTENVCNTVYGPER